MKCKCWSSPKGFDFGCHALRVRLGLRAFGPSPNVFVLALAFSPEWVPDVFFFFLSRGPEARWLGGPSWCSKNHQQCTRKLAPLNESHNCFKVKLHPFKPVLHITQRGAEKSVYLQFIAEWKPQRQKWDMCKLLWIHSVLNDESSMYKMGREREGWHNLCPAYLYDTRLWNGKIKGKLFRTKCELSCRLLMTRHGI